MTATCRCDELTCCSCGGVQCGCIECWDCNACDDCNPPEG